MMVVISIVHCMIALGCSDVSKDVEVQFLMRSQLALYMYILLLSVAVKHVFDEVLDHVHCNSHNCTSQLILHMGHCMISFILALSTHAVVSSAEFVIILFFHQLFVNCLNIWPGIQRVTNHLVPRV